MDKTADKLKTIEKVDFSMKPVRVAVREFTIPSWRTNIGKDIEEE
ncbi:MAG: hypothetical protein ACLSAP_10295 [Oscillospiraceae bacterium]